MSETKTKVDQAALKALREERSESIARARESIKRHNKVISAIRKALEDGGLTVPELAERLSMETEPVLRYVSTLKKYGVIGEGPKDGDYFKYELIS